MKEVSDSFGTMAAFEGSIYAEDIFDAIVLKNSTNFLRLTGYYHNKIEICVDNMTYQGLELT